MGKQVAGKQVSFRKQPCQKSYPTPTWKNQIQKRNLPCQGHPIDGLDMALVPWASINAKRYTREIALKDGEALVNMTMTRLIWMYHPIEVQLVLMPHERILVRELPPSSRAATKWAVPAQVQSRWYAMCPLLRHGAWMGILFKKNNDLCWLMMLHDD